MEVPSKKRAWIHQRCQQWKRKINKLIDKTEFCLIPYLTAANPLNKNNKAHKATLSPLLSINSVKLRFHNTSWCFIIFSLYLQLNRDNQKFISITAVYSVALRNIEDFVRLKCNPITVHIFFGHFLYFIS